jgi:hypothetical protein
MLNEDKIDERDIEEEGKDRKRKGWGIGKKMVIFGSVFLSIRNTKTWRPNKA